MNIQDHTQGDLDALLTIPQAAALSGFSEIVIRRALKKFRQGQPGGLRHIGTGRSTRIKKQWLYQWLEAR
jgi:hypothetical protein